MHDQNARATCLHCWRTYDYAPEIDQLHADTTAGAPIGEILANPQRFNKKRIVFNSVCNQPLSGYLEDFHRATQIKATLKTVPHNEAAAASADLADMFAYYKDHEYYGGETEDIIDISELSNVASSLTTFDQYIVKADLAATVK